MTALLIMFILFIGLLQSGYGDDHIFFHKTSLPQARFSRHARARAFFYYSIILTISYCIILCQPCGSQNPKSKKQKNPRLESKFCNNPPDSLYRKACFMVL